MHGTLWSLFLNFFFILRRLDMRKERKDVRWEQEMKEDSMYSIDRGKDEGGVCVSDQKVDRQQGSVQGLL